MLHGFKDDPNPLASPVQDVEYIPAFAERDIAGEVGMEFDIWVRASRDDEYAEHFVIRTWRRMQRQEPISRRPIAGQRATIGPAIVVSGGAGVKPGRLVGDDDQVHSPVLVYVGSQAEQEQSVAFRVGRSEWLKLLEGIDVFLAHELKEPVAPLGPLRWIGLDGKLNTSGLFIGRLDAIEEPDRQLPSKVVERAPQGYGWRRRQLAASRRESP